MLNALSIRDIVLIEKLDVSLSEGMTVLTGETGAGKSILLDALGLALGARGAAALVRSGADKGVVTAAFSLPLPGKVHDLLDEHGVEADSELVIRRIQTREGPSRAFINDQPVSVNLLKQVGGLLAEIHGQHDDRALMDAAGHRQLVDAYGGLEKQCALVGEAWAGWTAAREDLEAHEALISKAAADRDYLEHVAAELRDLAPQEGEEDTLAARRQMMMHAEQIADTVDEALQAFTRDGAFDARLNTALRKLEKRRDQAGGMLDELCEALDRVLAEVNEGQRLLVQTRAGLEFDPGELDRAEERLFALKAAGRKHGVQVDQLSALADRFEAELQAIQDGGNRLEELRAAAGNAHDVYMREAGKLSEQRTKAAHKLDEAVAAELEPLKLGQARFVTKVSADKVRGGPSGLDTVVFEVVTNPGAPLQPLVKIASGGELSRFMLALKAVLAESGSAPTLIFDEIDTGVGGAVADAVGQRLAELADGLQVLAVTHSPQVAARAGQHLLISKMQTVGDEDKRMVTRVVELPDDSRREEVARMLSAAEVTDEARAQAERLLMRAS
ncbi:MAG: DNA repair protein RecN [Rhizobiales bacterium]|nr:DNA repair protein RecN [Hyphomicrobiales bacterium]